MLCLLVEIKTLQALGWNQPGFVVAAIVAAAVAVVVAVDVVVVLTVVLVVDVALKS